jgi:hypothetical protein
VLYDAAMPDETSDVAHDAVEIAPLAPEASTPHEHFRALSPEDADAVRRELEQRSLLSAARAGQSLSKQLYEMRLAPEIAKGLREGRLYQVADGSGVLSMVKDKETGSIVGQARFGKLARLEVAGPAVWELAASITQQHYLAEMSEKLVQVDENVRELLARTRDTQWAQLRELEAELERVSGRASQGGLLSDLDLHELDRWLTQLGTVRREALLAIHRAPKQRDDREILGDLDNHLSDFAVAGFATQLILVASELKVSLTLDAALVSHVRQEEYARCLSALSDLVQTATLIAGSSDYWTEEWVHFNEARPRNLAVRAWNRGSGLIRPTWQTQAANEPQDKPLKLAQRDRLQRLVAATDESGRPRTLLAVDTDGAVSVSNAFT